MVIKNGISRSSGDPRTHVTIERKFAGRLFRTDRQAGARAERVSVFLSGGGGNLKRLVGCSLKLGNFSLKLDNAVAHVICPFPAPAHASFRLAWESLKRAPLPPIRSLGA